jgi:hypothetical protein
MHVPHSLVRTGSCLDVGQGHAHDTHTHTHLFRRRSCVLDGRVGLNLGRPPQRCSWSLHAAPITIIVHPRWRRGGLGRSQFLPRRLFFFLLGRGTLAGAARLLCGGLLGRGLSRFWPLFLRRFLWRWGCLFGGCFGGGRLLRLRCCCRGATSCDCRTLYAPRGEEHEYSRERAQERGGRGGRGDPRQPWRGQGVACWCFLAQGPPRSSAASPAGVSTK